VPGDFDGNQSCNVTDVTGLVYYLFMYGPPPCVLNAMDMNGSCTGPNIADVTYVVDYLFLEGNEPVCGCLGKSVPLPKVSPDISITSLYENDVTTIELSSLIDLRGVQLELKGAGATTVTNLLGEKLDLVYGQRDGILRVGLVDLDGADIIAAGEHQIISMLGQYELVSAIVSDMDHHDFVASTGSKLSELPDSYALDQNYPNPFNPVTAINFSIPAASHVKLEIYNIMGQKVATLVDRQMEAGRHTIQWDGSSAASGVYLYRLEAGYFVDTKKMTLLK
jgi:hypothetical protein